MATTYTWTGTDNNDWATDGNWNPNSGFPGLVNSDQAVINLTGAAPTISSGDGGITLASITMNAPSGALTVNDGIVNTATLIGENGNISIVAGGSVTVTTDPSIGAIVGDSSTLVVSGTTSLLDLLAGLSVQGAGTSEVEVVSGGTIEQNAVGGGIGLASTTGNTTGTLLVDGTNSLIEFGSTSKGITVGGNGRGFLVVSNHGSIAMSGTGGLVLGTVSTGSGNVLIETGGIINMGASAGIIQVGGFGTTVSTLDVESTGTLENFGTSNISVGISGGAKGVLLINGLGALVDMGSTTKGVNVGLAGQGSLQISAGGQLTIGADGMTVGATSGGSGTVTVTGINTGTASAIVTQGTAGAIMVGQSETGAMTISAGGTVIAATAFSAGSSFLGDGTILVTGTGSDLVAQGTSTAGTPIVTIGGLGSGELTINAGGTVSAAAAMNIGGGGTSTSSGTVIVGGTSTNAGSTLTVIGINVAAPNSAPGGGSGEMTILGGGQVSVTALGIVVGSGKAAGSIDVNGGSLSAGSQIVAVGTSNAVGAGTGELTVENAGSLSFANSFVVGASGTGSATIATGGVVTDSGTFNVDVGANTGGSGTLVINGGTFLDGSSSMLIGSNSGTGAATIEGTGGSLSVANGLTIGSGASGTLDVEAGSVTNTGALNLNIGSSGGSGTLIINGGSLTDTANNFFVGNTTASGTMQVNGGVLTTGTNTGGAPPFSDINATGGSIASVLVDDTGVWNSEGNLIVGDTGGGTLTISDGGTVNAGTNGITVGNQSSGTGVLSISGSGINESELEVGTLSIGGINSGTGAVTVGAFGLVLLTDVQMNAQATLAMAGGDLQVTGIDIINSPGQISGFGAIVATVSNTATITATGILNITGGIRGSGLDTIDSDATLEAGGIANTQMVAFANNVTNSALQLDALPSLTESFHLTNWQQGDALIINNGSSVTGVSWLNPGTNAGTLQVVTNGGTYDFNEVTAADTGLTPTFSFNANTITLVSCFARGTLIETARGPVAVEALSVGDVALTADGEHEAIIWIGQRTIDCASHPRPDAVWPVRIQAGAFGEALPARDLFLSPDHAVFVDGVLVPAKLLCNGTTIAQVRRERVTYFHVELPRHAVILAEQLPVESYLDIGDRAQFEGGPVIALYPEFVARAWEMAGCAELVSTGARLAAIQAALAAPPLAIAG